MEWSPRTLKCETPALLLPPERDRFALEHDATTLIAALPTPDGRTPIVLPSLDFTRGHKLYVKADPITRVRLHLEPMTEHDHQLALAGVNRRWDAHSAAERKTIVAHKRHCTPYAVRTSREPVATVVDGAGQWLAIAPPRYRTLYRTELVNGGFAWIGHQRVPMGDKTETVARKIARKARTSAGKRGPAVSWWSMSTRSLPRWWVKATDTQRATADTRESIIRTSARDMPVELCAGHAVIFDGSTVRKDEPASRTFPVREYARRAALAGLVID